MDAAAGSNTRVRDEPRTLAQPNVFPAGFLWGAATSAHQVEGDDTNSDWSDWERFPGRIADGTRSGDAAGWWHGRAESDLRLARALSHNAHRLSVAWSRLEPTPGDFDQKAFDRYREILGAARDLGLATSVTLYHFTLPRWVAAGGGWTHSELPERFARFASACVDRLGDLVDWWATINEPMILVYFGYLGTAWPPGSASMRAGIKALANMLRAHAAAYVAIKSKHADARVGVVLNMPAIDPARDHVLDRCVARAQDWAMNDLALRTLRDGVLGPPLRARREPLAGGPNGADWYGLNYYGRHRIRFDPRRPGHLFGREVQHAMRGHIVNWGEAYPEGLTRGLMRLAQLGRPIFVTENGINDADDTLRPAYLLRHLRAVHDASEQGADVRGYFHWSLIDNFEWAEGWSARFGLIALDPITQERSARPSATMYQQIINARGGDLVTEQLRRV